MKFGDFFQEYGITPRPQQQEVLDTLNKEWDNYKYFILSLPTGVGKTFISCDIANVAGPAYILTSTIQLQEQYEKSWKEIISLKGKSNYQCDVNRQFNCANAPCNVDTQQISVCLAAGRCPYINRRDAAMKSKAFITNPSYFIAASYHGVLSNVESCKRKTIIIDEAHVLEQSLVSIAEITFSISSIVKKLPFVKNLREIKFSNNITENIQAILKLQKVLQDYKEQLENNLKTYTSQNVEQGFAKSLSKQVISHLNEQQDQLDNLKEIYSPITMFKDDYELNAAQVHSRWVIQYNSATKEMYFAPIYASQIFNQVMSPRADKFVFMSATIGDKTEFCKELGLDISQTCFIETDTPFPAEKSLVKVIPMLKMGKNDIEETLVDIGPVISHVLDAHDGQKGIVHSATYKISESIFNGSPDKNKKRLLYRDMRVLTEGVKTRYNNEALVNMHINSKDATVLLSPSMNEGISLDDDLSRFQIITKMPWMSLGNPRIAKKTNLNPNWYANHMWNTIMQAAGRSTRNENDESVTYILDSSFKFFYDKWSSKLPTWFKKRVVFYS